jgi:hypothetical protein
MLKFYAAGGYGRVGVGDADPAVPTGAHTVQINLLTPRPEWPVLERPKAAIDVGPVPRMPEKRMLPTLADRRAGGAPAIPKVVTR